VPDCSIKEGTAFFLADAYAQQGNLAKASSVIQVDMYQSLMLMSQQLQLILVRDLYEEISDIEQRFKALQQGFNTNQL
ncbi:XRE family transcriptional regulator, partial [Staphylococcus capitis]